MIIAEVGKQFDISPDTLRYYEKIGLIPPVNRKENGIRDYNEEDLNWIQLIKCMRNAGLTIEVLTEYVQLFNQGDDTIAARKELLIEQRNRLKVKQNEMKETLDLLDYKIKVYDTKILEKEKELRKK